MMSCYAFRRAQSCRSRSVLSLQSEFRPETGRRALGVVKVTQAGEPRSDKPCYEIVSWRFGD